MDREYRRAFATGRRVRFRYFHSASRNWYDITAKTDSSDRLVVTMHDTTDLCRLEHALDSVESSLCEAFRNATIGVAITDANGRFVEVNQAYCAITGYSPEELRGRISSPSRIPTIDPGTWNLAKILVTRKEHLFPRSATCARTDGLSGSGATSP